MESGRFADASGRLLHDFHVERRQAAAAFAMNVEEQRTVPVHWHPYLAVESTDAAAIRAKELCGKVIEGPYDVQTFGRMAPLQDPAGAFFSVRKAKITSE